MNANSWFNKVAGARRGELRQNQFGGTLSGPLLPNKKLLFFISGQGTMQANGITSGCTATVYSPAALMTDSTRSATTLGAEFAGMTGWVPNSSTPAGVAVAADGSNISTPALDLLQHKLANGNFMMPGGQKTLTVAGTTEGYAVYSNPCTYGENQYMANLDYLTSHNVVSGRFFMMNSSQVNTFPRGNIPGFAQTLNTRFRTGNIEDVYTFTPHLVNDANFGINTIDMNAPGYSPVSYSGVGVSGGPQQGQAFLGITLAGMYSMLSGYNTIGNSQLVPQFFDTLSWTHGRHSLRFGETTIRQHSNGKGITNPNALTFESFPDFLLGLNASQRGSSLSNLYSVSGMAAANQRQYRSWDLGMYAQDDWKITRILTLNLGFHYEYAGGVTDLLGRNASWNPANLDTNPPSSGTLQGMTVASNYQGPTLPSTVTKYSNPYVTNPNPDTYGPRVGFAVQETRKMVLQGGYGLFVSVPPITNLWQEQQSAPWTNPVSLSGTGNAAASFLTPYPGYTEPTFPVFTPYSPTTKVTAILQSFNIKPGMIQNYSLNQQVAIGANTMVQIRIRRLARGTSGGLPPDQRRPGGNCLESDSRADDNQLDQHRSARALSGLQPLLVP